MPKGRKGKYNTGQIRTNTVLISSSFSMLIKIASSKAEKQRKEVAETLAERLGREQKKRLNNACLD